MPATIRRSFSATDAAASTSVSGSTIRNSSPPYRPAVSIARTLAASSDPTWRSTWSPALWPWESLRRLKWSRSTRITDSGWRKRVARASSWSTRSRTAWRLAIPVSGSIVASRQVSATRSARAWKAARSRSSRIRPASIAISAPSSCASVRCSASAARRRFWRCTTSSANPALPMRAPTRAMSMPTIRAAVVGSKVAGGVRPESVRPKRPHLVRRGYGRGVARAYGAKVPARCPCEGCGSRPHRPGPTSEGVRRSRVGHRAGRGSARVDRRVRETAARRVREPPGPPPVAGRRVRPQARAELGAGGGRREVLQPEPPGDRRRAATPPRRPRRAGSPPGSPRRRRC